MRELVGTIITISFPLFLSVILIKCISENHDKIMSELKNIKSIEDLEKEKLELEIEILKHSLNLKENASD